MATGRRPSVLRAALDLAAVAAECRRMDDLRDVLLPAVADATHAHLALLHQVQLEGGFQEYGTTWPTDEPSMVRALEGYPPVMAYSPLVTHLLVTRSPCVVAVSELMSRDAWRRNPVFRECHGALGIEDHLALILRYHPRATYGLSLARDGRSFGDRERAILRLVAPHVTAALQRAFSDPTPYRTIRTLPAPVEVWRSGAALAPDEQPPRLTSREEEVLALTAAGLDARRAARDLGISQRTVDKHLENAYRKLGVSSRLEAVARLRERGLA